MKKRILKIATLATAAVALVLVTVMVTVALLTSSSGVSNVFTVGSINIDMKESKVNADGQKIDPITLTDTNSYHLLPGKSYVKDPTIYIKSETDNMYLFVKSANLIRSAEAGNYKDRDRDGKDNDDTPLSMREQMEKYGWVEFVRSGDGTEIVWVYGTRDSQTGAITPSVVNKSTKQLILNTDGSTTAATNAGEFRLCDGFTTHKDVDVSVYGAAYVTFTGFAIQTTGFGTGNEQNHDLTKAAWAAIKDSFPYQCGINNPVNPYDLSKTGNDAYEAVAVPNAVFELLDAPKSSTTETQ